MTLKDIIDKYGIKHVHLREKMGLSKAGFHFLFRKGMSVKRSNELRTILHDMSKGIMEDLKKST